MNRSRRSWLIPAVSCAAIVAVTFAVFSGVRLNGFVWDTRPFVLQNPWIIHPGLHDFVAMFTQYYAANWQPMVWLSHALDFALFDHHAWLHHFSNVAYHTVDACLVYWLGVRILQDGSLPVGQRQAAAVLSAVLFAINPQHVQSVAWIVERKDTLYVLFTLLCFISYLWVQRRQIRGIRRALPTFLFALALMAKPMAVTVPVVLLLLDICPLDRWRGGLRRILGLVAEKWLLWLLSLAVVAITLHTQQGAIVSVQNLPVWVRPLTAINNSVFYVYCYLVPVNLSPYYPYATHVDEILRVTYWLPGLLFLAGCVTAGLWLWARGTRWPLLMLVFYVVTLLPVSGLVAVGPAKALNYYSYLATLPLGLLIALGIVRLWHLAGRARSVVIGLTVSCVLALALLSFQQVKFWRDDVTLWNRAYQFYPDSAYVNRNLAAALVAIGDYRQALVHAEKSAHENSLGEEYLQRLKAAIDKMPPRHSE